MELFKEGIQQRERPESQDKPLVREGVQKSVRSQPLSTLNQQSRERAIQLCDVDWSHQVDPRREWVPETFYPLSYLPSYKELSDDFKLGFNQSYALALCEQFIWFEQDLICPILRTVQKKFELDREMSEALTHFIDEEETHSEMFWRTLEVAAPKLYQKRRYHYLNYRFKQRSFFNLVIKFPKQFLAWIWMAIYFEERTMDISAQYKAAVRQQGKGLIDDLFQRVHHLHMLDEARHVQIDQHLLKYFYTDVPQWKRKWTGYLVEKVFRAYAAPKQIGLRILNDLVVRHPHDAATVEDLISELHNPMALATYQQVMFSDRAMGRTKELLRAYPEMSGALNIFEPST